MTRRFACMGKGKVEAGVSGRTFEYLGFPQLVLDQYATNRNAYYTMDIIDYVYVVNNIYDYTNRLLRSCKAGALHYDVILIFDLPDN